MINEILFCNQGFDEMVGGPAFSVPILAEAMQARNEVGFIYKMVD